MEKKRGLIFEREVSKIYVRKIWSRSVIKIISWNCTDITGDFNFQSPWYILYSWNCSSGVYLLSYVFEEHFQDVCAESEVFECKIPCCSKKGCMEETVAAA